MLPPGYPWVPSKNISPFCPAVWRAIGNIFTNFLFYNIDVLTILKKHPAIRKKKIFIQHKFATFHLNNISRNSQFGFIKFSSENSYVRYF